MRLERGLYLLFCLMLLVSSIPAVSEAWSNQDRSAEHIPTRSDVPPSVTLPDDFESEYPLEVSLKANYTAGTYPITSFNWNQTSGPDVRNLEIEGAMLNFTPTGPGTYEFDLTLEDTNGTISEPAFVNVTVIPNLPPDITDDNRTMIIEEDSSGELLLQNMIMDNDEELTYRINGTGPGIGINILGFGGFEIEPDPDFSGNTFANFSVEDYFNNTIHLDFSILVNPLDDAPVFTQINGDEVLPGIQDLDAIEGSMVWMNFTVSDPDLVYEGDALEMKCSDDRVVINGTSAGFVPSQQDVGDLVLTFRVEDSTGKNDSVTVLLSVENVNNPPSLSVQNIPSNTTIGESVTVTFTGTEDPDGDALSYEYRIEEGEWIEKSIPFELMFDEAGTFNYSFRATDTGGLSSVVTFKVYIDWNTDDDVVLPDDDDDDGSDDENEDNDGDGTFTAKIILIGLFTLALLLLLAYIIVIVIRIRIQDKGADDWEMEE